jgi:lysophospholipase L1-like esterase
MALFAALVLALALTGCGESSAASPDRAYAALGASETHGDGASPHTNGYAYLVARRLGAARFRDPAISGSTLGAAYLSELSSALSIRPTLCTLFFGFNDLRTGVPLATFRTQLGRLSASLRSHGCHVLIIGLPNLSLLPAVRIFFPDLGSVIARWNGAMKAVAQETGGHFLDLRRYSQELSRHPEYISGDGLHPSNLGHARLADVVVATVRRNGLWP